MIRPERCLNQQISSHPPGNTPRLYQVVTWLVALLIALSSPFSCWVHCWLHTHPMTGDAADAPHAQHHNHLHGASSPVQLYSQPVPANPIATTANLAKDNSVCCQDHETPSPLTIAALFVLMLLGNPSLPRIALPWLGLLFRSLIVPPPYRPPRYLLSF